MHVQDRVPDRSLVRFVMVKHVKVFVDFWTHVVTASHARVRSRGPTLQDTRNLSDYFSLSIRVLGHLRFPPLLRIE